MAGYGAMLDACVLVPIVLADTLLRVAEADLYRPLWSAAILREACQAVVAVRPDIAPESIARRFAAMDETFEDALVTGWEPLVGGIDLPDAADRHVVAAAIRGDAQCIVTANRKDFPASALDPYGLVTVHPDAFLLNQLDLSPTVVIDALRDQAKATEAPPLDLADVLARLSRAGVPEFADEVRRHVPW